MEKKNTSVLYNGLVWGLILGFATIIFNVILYMMDQYGNQALGYIGILITIIILIFGMRSFRDQIRGGVMSYGTAFGFGLVAVLVSSLLGAIYSYLLTAVIDPDVMQKIINMAIDKAIQKGRGGATPEMIEQGMEMMSWMFKPGIMSVLAFVSGGFFGTIVVLIMAAIFKRDEDPNAGLEETEEAPAE